MITFAVPSPLRALTCSALFAAFACVAAGVALFTAAIFAHDDGGSTQTSEYVLLFVVGVTSWGPILLLTAWPMSVPVILVIGTLVACIRGADRRTATRDDDAAHG